MLRGVADCRCAGRFVNTQRRGGRRITALAGSCHRAEKTVELIGVGGQHARFRALFGDGWRGRLLQQTIELLLLLLLLPLQLIAFLTQLRVLPEGLSRHQLTY